MTLTPFLLCALGFGLAYANGANDVSKGIATLVGTGVSDYRRAILWGAAWTALGGVLSATFATAMVSTFGGGLIADGTAQTVQAGIATLAGAAAWVFIATRTGLPVSTTHAIVGALVGVAAAAYGVQGVRWSALGGKVVIPLLATPALSLALVVVLLRASKRFLAKASADCLCVSVEAAQPILVSGTALASHASGLPLLRLSGDTQRACKADSARVAVLTLDRLHWFTAGATSFARGMNDAPKIVALVLAASALGAASEVPRPFLFALVTVGMVAGSLVAGRRVTRVLAENVTAMDHREGFLANLVTAGLVTAGATLGLPMSTTHVSAGGIVGAGAERSTLNVHTLRHMVMAWVVTLPAAAALGVSALMLLGWSCP